MSNKIILNRIKRILNDKVEYKTGNLFTVVDYILKRKNRIIKLASQHRTPFYLIDKKALNDSIDSFLDAFTHQITSFKPYYALKINHHPQIVKHILSRGVGLDVASIREIDIAINAGCKNILYFSPGKKKEDILYALKYADLITIHIDSFNELKKIGEITNKNKKNIRAGIRIYTESFGDWSKYGININDLNKFWREANKYPYISLQGIHFHKSRNKDATFYIDTIRQLSTHLKKFSKKELENIKYIDLGGGFEAFESEGFYPYETPQGKIIQLVNSYYNIDTSFKEHYYIRDSIKISEYAKRIGDAIRTYLDGWIKADYYLEPGRFICNNCMHIALSVADVKNKNKVILDGGVNMVGWQRFEHEYFPLVNITRPSKKELKCKMWGKLCTTWDIWGYYCYAKEIKENDIIIVPNQGALTYSLAQSFILPIPPAYQM